MATASRREVWVVPAGAASEATAVFLGVVMLGFPLLLSDFPIVQSVYHGRIMLTEASWT